MHQTITIIVELVTDTQEVRRIGKEVEAIDAKIRRLKNIQKPQELADEMCEANKWQVLTVFGQLKR